ncbi:unnamed protein product [Sphenostylis stenocarpa]|uniref:Uncharacterized protein n=1 Tax=Sphenostylis stenocarpa TaxID=92480 RepID=A0AA86VD40_9FABA|nr:unnamed protein product [Sphenostylis stenocarpa]
MVVLPFYRNMGGAKIQGAVILVQNHCCASCLEDIHTLYFFPIFSTKSGDIVGNDGYNGLAKCNEKGKFKEFRRYFGGE